jgi:formylmethanofuran dehydrogenase subunit E-like metal-binding protein
MTAKPCKHPRLTKGKACFVTHADHLRVVKARKAADARRAAREKELQQEDEYLHKRKERLRLMVVCEGQERLQQNMQHSPSWDPMFNGQDKAAGVKHAMELSEVPARARSFDNIMHGSQTFSGHLVQHHPPSVVGCRQ